MGGLTCLFGNGASIAYNGALSTSKLTCSMNSSIEGLPDSDAKLLLQTRFEGATDGFEALIGSLDQTTVMPDGSTASMPVVQRAKRIAVAIVLKEILDQAHGMGESSFAPIASAIKTMVGEESYHAITVGTLNYDGILLSSFLYEFEKQIVDLADGQQSAVVSFPNGGSAQKLRTRENLSTVAGWDFFKSRPRFLQLHGYLGWFRNLSDQSVLKFDLDVVRGSNAWLEQAQLQTPSWEPAVVLSDLKASIVQNEPFALAYEIFAHQLFSSDRWIVGGYGFGDEPMNTLMRSVLSLRRFTSPHAMPRILVVDSSPTVCEKARTLFDCAGMPSILTVESRDLKTVFDDSAFLANWYSID